MSGLRLKQSGERGSGLRARLVVWVVLPVAILGVSYFLFVEYILASGAIDSEGIRVALRLGGMILVLLGLILGVTCGYVLVDRVTRPIRLLLRLAETGELSSGRGVFVHNREWEIFQLYRRVNALVQQNRAGAKALAELESLRQSLGSLRESLQRTGQHGIMAPLDPISGGPLEEIVASLESNRTGLLEFFGQLRERIGIVRLEADAVAQAAGLTVPGDAEDPAEPTVAVEPVEAPVLPDITETLSGIEQARVSMKKLQRIGTILALEAERVGGSEGRRVGLVFDRFQGGLHELDGAIGELASLQQAWVSAAERNGDPSDSDPALDSEERQRTIDRWNELTENLASLERRLQEVQ